MEYLVHLYYNFSIGVLEEIMEQSSLFQFSIDNALEIILIFDADGTIMYANQSAESQLSYQSRLQGLSIMDIVPGVFQEQAGLLRFMGKSDGTFQNIMLYRGNKTCFPAKGKVITYPALYNGRKVYLCTATNITAENFLEKKAEQEKKKDYTIVAPEDGKVAEFAALDPLPALPVAAALGAEDQQLRQVHFFQGGDIPHGAARQAYVAPHGGIGDQVGQIREHRILDVEHKPVGIFPEEA